jgi:hypothetical protein
VSAGSANKSGWMTGDDFTFFMEYFIKVQLLDTSVYGP